MTDNGYLSKIIRWKQATSNGIIIYYSSELDIHKISVPGFMKHQHEVYVIVTEEKWTSQ